MFFLFFALAIISQAAPKGQMDLREISRNMAVKGPPDQSIRADWAIKADSHTNGVTAYRYVHAMVNASIFGEKQKIRETARRWLQNYECENWLGCQSYLDYLNLALEKSQRESDESELESFKALKVKIGERIKMFASQAPDRSGVCSPHSRRAAWLEQEYRLLCPTKPGKNHLCPNCMDTNWLKKRIDQDSGQMVMSSAFLKDMKHEGSADCRQPWKVTLTCDGAAQAKYILRCERKAPGVRCKE